MGFSDALRISGSGLEAERVRLNVLAGNLANADATRGNPQGVYERRDVIFAAVGPGRSFSDVLNSPRESPVKAVKVLGMVWDPRPLTRTYDPQNPDAGKDGFVFHPNVSKLEEMTNLIDASRAYEANLTALDTTKRMASKDLTIHV